MHPNAFIGRSEQPGDSDLKAVLGPAKALWDELLADLAGEWKLSKTEWSSYSPKYGWALRVKRGSRNIVYLGPSQNLFAASFIFGAKAVAAAHAAKLPARVLRLIDAGKKYPEGTGVRVEVRSEKDLPIVRTLTQLKLEH